MSGGMNWFVVRHPEIGGGAVVPETSLEHYLGRGWMKCSEPIGELDKDHIDFDDYPLPTEEPAKQAKKKEQQ